MNFLPIVGRELRVAARRRAVYWRRFTTALLAIALSGWMILITTGSTGAVQSTGREIFAALSALAFIYCLIAGTQTTADCVSEEKREGTLGLLFLTDLKGYDVVLGKLAATSLNAFYSLLAIFPVMALPLLMGGVTPGQFGRMTLTLVNTLFFSLAAGMFVSGLMRRERDAVGLTIALIIFFVGILPLAGLLCAEFIEKRTPPEPRLAFLLPSPGYAYGLVAQWNMRGKTDENFWWSSLTIHLLGWVFLLSAMWIVPRSWKDKPASVVAGSWRERWRNLNYGDAAWRKAFRARLLLINPILWLSGRNRLEPAWLWILFLFGAIGWWCGYKKYPRDWLEAPVAISSAVILHTLLKLRLAAAACRRFAEDRHEGALELLLCTPLGVKRILRGQWLALQRQFLWPIFFVLAADLLLLLGALRETRIPSGQGPDLVMTFVAGMVVLVIDAVTLSWVGMWRGLFSRTYTLACSWTITRVLILPWAIFIGAGITIDALDLMRTINWGYSTVLGFWFALVLGIDLWLWFWARRKLLNEFRLEAARKYQAGRLRRRWWFFGRRATV